MRRRRVRDLKVERRGRGPRLVLLHGFTQTARSWNGLGDGLSNRFEVVSIDAPGHGGSSEVRADLPSGAALVADADAGGHGTYVGYSMGGRLALHVALAFPQLV